LGGLLGKRLGRTANTQLTVGAGSTTGPNGIVTASRHHNRLWHLRDGRIGD
jgi:hypothetical protein